MRVPTDDEIARFLCCGKKCEKGPNTGFCHRWDFVTETAKVRALLEELQAARLLEPPDALRRVAE